MLKQKIVGYSAREMWSNYDEWPAEYKTNFLLRSDIVKPLSVGMNVWGSAFSQANIQTIEHKEGRLGWRQHTWSQLAKLEQYLDEYKISGCWTIAITQFMDDLTCEEIGIDQLPVEPDKIVPQWQFLGYDSADMTLHSGLMGMGYDVDEFDTGIPQEYAPHLNEYHLFTDFDKALSFAGWANKRDPGHGPFYVYGLYQIASTIADSR